MTSMVQVAVAADVTEAEEIQAILVEAGIESIADDPVARARWARTMRNAASRGDALIHERPDDDIRPANRLGRHDVLLD